MEESEGKQGKKRLRQTSLEDCFGSGIKRKKSIQEQVETLLLEDIERGSMSDQLRGESLNQKRRREQMAEAAERRRASQSSCSTPPNDPPSSPDSSQESPEKLPRSKVTDDAANKPSASVSANSSRDNRGTGNSSRNFESVFAYLDDPDNEKASTSASCLYPSNRTSSRVGESSPSTSTKQDDPEGSSGQKTNLPACTDFAQKRHKLTNALLDAFEVDDDENEAGVAEGDVSPTLEYESSLPLFSDSEPQSSQDDAVQINKDVTRIECRGVNVSELNRAPACRRPLPKLKPSSDHTVLFKLHIRSGTPPRPYPNGYRDTWDAHHVRMPCSVENLYPVDDINGQKKVQSRWELITTTLLSPIKNSWDLEEAILIYNARYCSKWNFAGLHHFFTEEIDRKESNHFFAQLLPKMVQLALMMPKICTQAIPLLKRQQPHTTTMTQLQIASLLANAFFCTYPRRNAQQKKSEYSRFPEINFNRLFEGSPKKSSTNQRKAEKLRCVINYFRRVALEAPTGTVSFTRRATTKLPNWEKSSKKLTRFHGNVYGMIEDEGEGMLQLDFANMYVGGGVLGHGLVQEEIRFMICPELIVSRLFTEVLDANECLIIKGAERFSDYTGYASSFRWNGDYQDKLPRDSWGRKETEILAIDALVFRCFEDQFKPKFLQRELNKAFCGFYGEDTSAAHLPAVATGNWGCGAFGGDARLKGLLQMMVAAQCQRDIAYFTFGDQRLCYELHKMNEFLVSQDVTVGDLWLVLQRYREEVLERRPKRNLTNLYTFIYQVYNDFESSTDGEGDDERGGPSQEAVGDGGSLSPDYKVDTP